MGDRTSGTQIRAMRLRGGWRRWLLAGGALAVVVAGAAGAWLLRSDKASGPGRPRAVIVDQLALTDANPGFVRTAAQTLEAAGYHVDYYRADEVTVGFYRDLPSMGYSLVVLRSHSTDLSYPIGGGTAVPTIGLFTNEPYSLREHTTEQLAHELTVDSYPDRGILQRYFGVTAAYISTRARGDFAGAKVILMGCAGLKGNDLARAFVGRGASTFIGWDAAVTAAWTDRATEALLANLVAPGADVATALARTQEQVGPDPTFGARLIAYP